jgi:hypothetical protein
MTTIWLPVGRVHQPRLEPVAIPLSERPAGTFASSIIASHPRQEWQQTRRDQTARIVAIGQPRRVPMMVTPSDWNALEMPCPVNR